MFGKKLNMVSRPARPEGQQFLLTKERAKEKAPAKAAGKVNRITRGAKGSVTNFRTQVVVLGKTARMNIGPPRAGKPRAKESPKPKPKAKAAAKAEEEVMAGPKSLAGSLQTESAIWGFVRIQPCTSSKHSPA